MEPPATAHDDGGAAAAHLLQELPCSGDLTHFLASQHWQFIWLRDFASEQPLHSHGPDLTVSMREVRAREEAREAGSFLCFLRAVPTCCTCLIIENVHFEAEEELSALCHAIPSPLCTLQLLRLDHITSTTVHSPSASSCRDVTYLIADVALRNPSLLRGALSLRSPDTIDLCLRLLSDGRNACGQLLLHDDCPLYWPFETINNFYPGGLHMCIPADALLHDDVLHQWLLTTLFTGLANNTISFRTLRFVGIAFTPTLHKELCQMLLTNASLTHLHLLDLHLSGAEVLMLFTSLEKNLNLTILSLSQCYGEGWPSITSILDSLRINGVITGLDLVCTPLADRNNATALEAQLAKNRANVEHLNALKSRGSQLVQPTRVRLFLCGLPYSGKTTLSRSLANWDKPNSSFLRSRLRLATPKRTRGIEVTNLQKDAVKVSLWDLAGQREFYSFHDYMLPTLTNEATPSMFLFVWNPIQVDQSTGRELKDDRDQFKLKSIDGFRQEFNYWLMFIASKTLKSVKFRPKVLVAITRADKSKQTGLNRRIEHIFHQFQEEFKDYLDLDIHGVFEVDARYPHQVRQLALHVFDAASRLLKSVPLGYEACDDARRMLSEIAHIKPVMTKDDFFSLCHRRLGIDTEGMQEAIAHSLNNSGDLIYFKSVLLVVVDVKWFCHDIMGSLLEFGMNSENERHELGIFPRKFLEELLEEGANCKYSVSAGSKQRKSIRFAFKSRRNKSLGMQRKIKGEDLVKLLIELGLACQHYGKPGIFIPACLCTGQDRSQIQPCHYLKGDREHILTFLGRRLRCKNAVCTFFTPGFFPALQVMFHHIYSIQHGGLVTLKEDVIAFARGGVEVFMEFCHQEGERQFIDILVQSHLDLDQTIEWIHEEILEKVNCVCAGPRGLQGVELAHEVIRPACVKKLNCLEKRKTQAVSLEELRASLKSCLEKKGSPSLLEFEDGLKNAFHTWQTVNTADRLIDLLGNEETRRVVESYRQKFIMDIDDALGINIEREICIEKVSEVPEFSSTLSGKQRGVVYNEVREVRKDIQVLRKDIQEMRKDLQKILISMDNIRNAALPKLQQRMQELLKFSKEGEAGRLPRFFVVTESEGRLRKIVAAMVPGLQNVRLELLCEQGPHLVVDQCGLEFETLEDGLLKSGLPYIITVLKVARVAMIVGAHVFAGLGDGVPDFTRVLALIVDAPKPSPAYTEPDAPFRDAASRINFQEGQQWLREILSKHGCSTSTRIHEVFGLTCVRYPDSRIGWLCDEHRAEGEIWLM